MPRVIILAEGRKISAKLAKTGILRQGLGLKVTVGLSDIVGGCEEDAYLPSTTLLSQGLSSEGVCVSWLPIPQDISSGGNIQQVERQGMPTIARSGFCPEVPIGQHGLQPPTPTNRVLTEKP